MRSLPPVVTGVDGNNLELGRVDEIDFEFLGYMLSCHLVIEHYLDEFLMKLGTRLKWDEARLTFNQKIALFPTEIYPRGNEVVAAIKHLNRMRNKVAHNLKAKPANFDFEPFKTFLMKGPRGDEIEIPTEPVGLLETFTQFICMGFAGWVASDAHRTTWRNEKAKAKTGST